jgi:hypothetical protein
LAVAKRHDGANQQPKPANRPYGRLLIRSGARDGARRPPCPADAQSARAGMPAAPLCPRADRMLPAAAAAAAAAASTTGRRAATAPPRAWARAGFLLRAAAAAAAAREPRLGGGAAAAAGDGASGDAAPPPTDGPGAPTARKPRGRPRKSTTTVAAPSPPGAATVSAAAAAPFSTAAGGTARRARGGASGSGGAAAVRGPAVALRGGPADPVFAEVPAWVAFSDLHVSHRTADVAVEVLRRVRAEAEARGAGVLFLGVRGGRAPVRSLRRCDAVAVDCGLVVRQWGKGNACRSRTAMQAAEGPACNPSATRPDFPLRRRRLLGPPWRPARGAAQPGGPAGVFSRRGPQGSRWEASGSPASQSQPHPQPPPPHPTPPHPTPPHPTPPHPTPPPPPLRSSRR